ncbi:MAG: prolipoprotein diacylglyceryl transferase [Candidatus Sumerlaeaceae bacterium]|nr:prolipoprotein diacylglyceryl transferase [Candidatus Sumerlaeaceae bacterium]
MHPVLLRIGQFELPSYGVLVALGILCGWILADRLARRCALPQEFILDLIFWCVVAGLVGGRVTYVIVEWREFLADPLGTLFSRAGQVFLGGFLVALGALYVVSRRHGVSPLLAMDVLAPALALGHAFGRVGCFFAGCCYGAPTQSHLSVCFPRLVNAKGEIVGSLAYLDHLAHGYVSPDAVCSLPVHPVQLYEALGNVVICGLLFLLWLRRKFVGQIALSYVLLYSIMRFGLEFLRGDASRGVYFGLSTSQWLSLALLMLAAFFWLRVRAYSHLRSDLTCPPSKSKRKNDA